MSDLPTTDTIEQHGIILQVLSSMQQNTESLLSASHAAPFDEVEMLDV